MLNKTHDNPLGTSEMDTQLGLLRDNIMGIDQAANVLASRFANVLRTDPPAPASATAPKAVREAMQSPYGSTLQDLNDRLLGTLEAMRDLDRRACL